MRAVIQRVEKASVSVDGAVVGKCGKGFLVLLCVMDNDSFAEAEFLCKKISNLRIFEDENGRINKSLKDVSGELLIISQFTLAANCVHGNRPDFFAAAKPEYAKELFDRFVELMRTLCDNVQTGAFGEHMRVELLNDGPFTVVLDTDQLMKNREKK